MSKNTKKSPKADAVRGRPRVYDDNMTKRYVGRTTQKDFENWCAKAKHEGLTVSSWLRRLANIEVAKPAA